MLCKFHRRSFIVDIRVCILQIPLHVSLLPIVIRRTIVIGKKICDFMKLLSCSRLKLKLRCATRIFNNDLYGIFKLVILSRKKKVSLIEYRFVYMYNGIYMNSQNNWQHNLYIFYVHNWLIFQIWQRTFVLAYNVCLSAVIILFSK